MLFVMYICLLASDLYRLMNGFVDGDVNCSDWYFVFDNSFACLIFSIFHWFFTSHYLKIACIFKQTFSDPGSNPG